MDALTTSILAVRQADTQTRVDYAVAKKMLDSQKQTGDAAVKMIEAAVDSQATLAKAVGGVGGVGGCVDCQG